MTSTARISAQPVPTGHSSDALTEALALIEAFSPFGRRLLHWARRHNVEITCKDMADLAEYTGGTRPKIALNSENDLIINIIAIPHEIMHAIQDIAHGRLKPPHKTMWDGRTRALYDLLLEAPAEVCSARVYHEINTAGHPLHAIINGYQFIYSSYTDAFNDASAAGKTLENCVQEACETAYHAYFKIPPALYYLHDILEAYVEDIALGKIPHNAPAAGTVGRHHARALAELRDGEYLVNDIRLPQNDDELFLGHRRLRQAYDFVELKRLLMTGCSESSPKIIQMKQALLDDENPYAYLTLKNIFRTLNRRKQEAPGALLLNVMNEMAATHSGPHLVIA